MRSRSGDPTSRSRPRCCSASRRCRAPASCAPSRDGAAAGVARAPGRASDEEFLLRATMPATQVDAMRAVSRRRALRPGVQAGDGAAAPGAEAAQRRGTRVTKADFRPRAARRSPRPGARAVSPSEHGSAAGSRKRAPVRGVVFDVDGTLLLSNRTLGDYQVLPGAVEVLSMLRQRHVPFALFTNGSAYPPAEQAAPDPIVNLAGR